MAQKELLKTIQKMLDGKADQEDITQIKAAIAAGNQSVAIGGNADGAFIQIGDINFNLTSGALRALIQTPYEPPKLEDINEPQPPANLPPGSRMVFLRNQIFTGREERLLALAKDVFEQPSPTLVTQSIVGIGGIGKTQMVVEFCYRYGRYFQGVHWIDAATVRGEKTLPLRSKFEGEIATCGAQMMLPDWSDKQPEQVRQTLVAWQKSGPRLIVLDNLEDVEGARAILELLQAGGHLRVLITARRQKWPEDIVKQTLQLGVFKEEECLEFLRKYLPDENKYPEADLKELAKRLGYLPLALELAGRYLKRMKVGVTEYLKKLKTVMEHPSMKNWRPEYGNPTEHDLSLRGTFLLSWAGVKSEDARQVFRMISWCAPLVPVPKLLLMEATRLDNEGFAEALIELEDVGLATHPEQLNEPQVHPLVGEFGQFESKLARGIEDLERIAYVLAERAKSIYETGVLLEYEPYKEQVSVVARNAETEGLKVAGALYSTQGYHLHAIGDFYGAKEMFERALPVVEKFYGPEDPLMSTIMNSLALVLHDMGEYEDAKMMYLRALDIDGKIYGLEHPNVARDLSGLGAVIHRLGDYDGGINVLYRALKIVEKVEGLDHPHVGFVASSLADVLCDKGDYEGAKKMLERALTIAEKAHTSEDGFIGVVLNSLGMVLFAMEDYHGAKQMLERALSIVEKVYVTDHPFVGTVVSNLGLALKEIGKYQEAKIKYERALAIAEKTLNPEHPTMSTLFSNIGQVLYEMKDYFAAKQMNERALAIAEKAHGSEHPQVATILNNFGSLLVRMRNYSDAKQMYERSLKILEKSLPPDHPNIKNLKWKLRRLDRKMKMKSKYLSPLFIVGIAIVLLSLISWIAFPAWQTRSNGLLELLGVVLLGVLVALRNLFGILKDFWDLQKDKEIQPNSQIVNRVEARGERSVAIGGDADGAVIITGDDNSIEK